MYTLEELDWLHRHYFLMDHNQLETAFKDVFGYFKSGKTLRRKCYNDGLRKQVKGLNKSHYIKGDKRFKFMKRNYTKESEFKRQCTRLGLVEALLKGYSPV